MSGIMQAALVAVLASLVLHSATAARFETGRVERRRFEAERPERLFRGIFLPENATCYNNFSKFIKKSGTSLNGNKSRSEYYVPMHFRLPIQKLQLELCQSFQGVLI